MKRSSRYAHAIKLPIGRLSLSLRADDQVWAGDKLSMGCTGFPSTLERARRSNRDSHRLANASPRKLHGLPGARPLRACLLAQLSSAIGGNRRWVWCPLVCRQFGCASARPFDSNVPAIEYFTLRPLVKQTAPV